MRLLLDTHTFLWWLLRSKQLSQRVVGLLDDSANDLFLSAASGWEVAAKRAAGRIGFDDELMGLVEEALRDGGIHPLAVEMRHALRTAHLPYHHSDPIDRLLVAQAQLDSLTLLTRDPLIAQYDVATLW